MRRLVVLVLVVFGTAFALPAAAGAQTQGPPAVSGSGVRELGPSGATFIGRVDPRGRPTSFRFEYGPTTAFSRRTASAPVAPGAVRPVSTRSGVLRPNTLYNFRLVARNASGVVRGPTRRFRTPRDTRGVVISIANRPVSFGEGTVVIGRVLGQGVGGVRVALERRRFPYTEPFSQLGAERAADANGGFRFESGPLFSRTRLRVVTRNATPVASQDLLVSTRVRPGLRVRRAREGRVRLSGSTAPAVPGARASLQRRRSDGSFVPVRRGEVRPLNADRSAYGFTIRRRSSSTIYRIVVTPPQGGAHVRGISRERVVGGSRRR